MIGIDYGQLPEWHSMAQCSKPGHDPRDWDTRRADNGRRDRAVRAATLCAGCPVIEQCAAQALAEQPTGVVMAGMCMPSYRPWKGNRHHGLGAALEAVAAGWPMPVVVAAMVAPPRCVPALLALGGVPGYESPGTEPGGPEGRTGAQGAAA